jgi:ferrous iron transport protein B
MHCVDEKERLDNKNSIALIGQPNVGKSVIFQQLTGQYVTVANYPGTTVELATGKLKDLSGTMVIDTPGIMTFPSRTEDEQVTAQVLFDETLQGIIQVGDAKNLRRTLLLTLQLSEMGIPLTLALNMMDEAEHRGVSSDLDILEKSLGIHIVPTVAVKNSGVADLLETINGSQDHSLCISYPEVIELAITDLEPLLPKAQISPRSLAILWLIHDPIAETWIEGKVDPEKLKSLSTRKIELGGALSQDPSSIIQQTRIDHVDRLIDVVLRDEEKDWGGLSTVLGNLAIEPLWGILIMASVLYGLYWFVGIFGAGTLVDFMEGQLFGNMINPWVTSLVERLLPIPIIADLLIGEYGLWTMGMTYALALILPIVTTFFLAFGLLEDSGYLPRISVLSNRLFQFMGLNGKAVLPMILGLGCVTMATLTTRIMENKRDRFLVILLLALAVPCSAQLGVVMGMLASISFSATLIWLLVILVILLSIGWLAAKVVPGERTSLLIELPPMRRPVLSNVVTKTFARLEWYIREVIPLFLIGTGILFLMDQTGLLVQLEEFSKPLVSGWLGLPQEASAAFLLGFLRRDFGATGLFVMAAQGMLSPIQVVVSMVTITLFIPCVASIFMIAKTRGWRTAALMSGIIFPLSFVVGGLLNRSLEFTRWLCKASNSLIARCAANHSMH